MMRRRLAMLLIPLLALMLVGCKEVAYGDLAERDVNEMLSVLRHHGIGADKVQTADQRFELHVAGDDLAAAIDLLGKRGFPRERYADMGEIFSKDGLLSSPLEERVRFIYALSERVSETLSHIDGVLTARVHLVIPENNPFADGVVPSSASVFIKHHPDFPLDNLQSDIKLIVQKSIEGLEYERITVVIVPAHRTEGAADVVAASIGGTAGGGISGWLGALGLVCLALFSGLWWQQRRTANVSQRQAGDRQPVATRTELPGAQSRFGPDGDRS